MNKCIICDKEFSAKRKDAVFCSPGCRQKSSRKAKDGNVADPEKGVNFVMELLHKYAPSKEEKIFWLKQNLAILEASEELKFKKLPNKLDPLESNLKQEIKYSDNPVFDGEKLSHVIIDEHALSMSIANAPDIEEQIAIIRAEQMPKHITTPLGKKSWLFDQNKRIEELKKLLK